MSFSPRWSFYTALGARVSSFPQGKGPSCPGCLFLLLSVGVSQSNHKWRRCSRLHLVIRTKKERWIHRSKRTVWSRKGKGLSRSGTNPDKLKWSKDPQYDLKGGGSVLPNNAVEYLGSKETQQGVQKNSTCTTQMSQRFSIRQKTGHPRGKWNSLQCDVNEVKTV